MTPQVRFLLSVKKRLRRALGMDMKRQDSNNLKNNFFTNEHFRT